MAAAAGELVTTRRSFAELQALAAEGGVQVEWESGPASEELVRLCGVLEPSGVASAAREYATWRAACPDTCLTFLHYAALRLPSPRPRCVLVNHGSFNPVHRCHIEMMVQARAAAERAGYEAAVAIMAPTSPQWVRSKGADLLDGDLRIAAMRAAAEPYDWLRVDPRGVRYSSGQSMLHKLIMPELNAISAGDESGGASRVAFYDIRGVESEPHPTQHGLAKVYVDRGCFPALVDEVAEVNHERIAAGRPPHLHVTAVGDVSSTALRKALRENDRASVEAIAGSLKVADMLWGAKEAGRLFEGDVESPPRCGCVCM